jgi:hypothetical protein
MTNTEKPKKAFFGNTLTILILICFFIFIGLFTLDKYQSFFKEKEIDITVIDNDSFETSESSDEIKSDIKDVFQIHDENVIVEPKNEYVLDESNIVIELSNKIETLTERVSDLEAKIHEFNQISVKIPNYQQLILTIIDLENSIKKGQEFASLILKINNITQDKYILSRTDAIADAKFLKLYGDENLYNEFKKSTQIFQQKNSLKAEDTVFQQLLGDFIVIRKTDNFSDEYDDLIAQAEIFLIEGQIQGAIDNLILLDQEHFVYFAEYVNNAQNYLKALKFCDEIKSYLNL